MPGRVAGLFEPGDLAPADDALARRKRETVRRTLGLAESTLDAQVRDLFDLGRGFEMLEVNAFVGRQDNVWSKDRVWIGEARST